VILVEHNNHAISAKCQDTGLFETVVNKVHDSEDQAEESEVAINR
jgi:hypothetical protein